MPESTSFFTHGYHICLYLYPMSLPLRITFEQTDYTYHVITKGIDKSTASIKISLMGKEFNLVRNSSKDWTALEETIEDPPGLLSEIGRNIALRYRL